MEGDPRRELKRRLRELELIAKQDGVQKKVYDSFSGLCYLATEAVQSDFRSGWARNILDARDRPLFTREEADIIEKFAKSAIQPIVKDSAWANFTGKQRGGKVPIVPPSMDGIIKMASQIDPSKISLDQAYWAIQEFISNTDAQAKDLSRTLGAFRFFYETPADIKVPIPIPIPAPPFVFTVLVPIPSRAVPFLIGVFVETIRLIATFTPFTPAIFRELLSIVLAVIDLLQGEWKHAILSLAGYWGAAPMMFGIIGKVFLNVLSMIAPDLRERLLWDLYQSSKSLMIGSILWLFATFAPDFVRNIVRKQFDAMAALVDKGNDMIDQVEESMKKISEPAGISIDLKAIPEGMVPSFDDIQNLQSIVRQPGIYCSKEFNDIIEPLRYIPPIRLLLELMSIPTDARSMEMECRGIAGKSISDTVADMVAPDVSLVPGSPLEQALTATGSEIPGVSGSSAGPEAGEKGEKAEKEAKAGAEKSEKAAKAGAEKPGKPGKPGKPPKAKSPKPKKK
jgi:hypothetical protein